ncbi:MAG: ATP-dependent Clp protease adaptor ClpS, partial [Janthinobacterium lividum]
MSIVQGKQSMPETVTTPDVQCELEVERPHRYKVMLLNDAFTPPEFVVLVLKAEFQMDEGQASRVMMTAHQQGVCVVAVFTREVAEAKATTATDMARKED